MELFLSVEGQNCEEIGLINILREINSSLSFITDKKLNLRKNNNYGEEFESIAIIPTCMESDYLKVLGWKERILISRKKKEADVRLKMDYLQFLNSEMTTKRLLFIGIIIKSINVLADRSKNDFKSEKLISDILNALNVNFDMLGF